MHCLLWCFCLLAESYETINHYHYHQKKNQLQQRSHSNWRLSSDVIHLPLDFIDSSEISPTQFYIWQKTTYGIRYFLSFETESWICWLLRSSLNILCELNFIGQQIFNESPWTGNCPNLYTHEPHQPNLIYIQVVLKFENFLWSSFAHLKVLLWHALENTICNNNNQK